MAKPPASLATALLDAHVAYFVEDLTGPGLKQLIDEEIDAALELAGKLKLGDVVTRAQIKATAITYAASLELGPGIPELVGDIARQLHAHAVHDKTTPGDLVSDERVAEWLDQVFGFETLRDKLIREAVTSPIYSDFAADLLYQGITGYLQQNAVTKNIPGASSMLKLGRAALSKAKPDLEASLEDGLRRYIAKAVQASTKHSADFLIGHASKQLLTEIGLDAWEKIRKIRLGSLRHDVGSREVEELFVLGYETWREVRTTDYYRLLIESGIDAFFDKYEGATLAALLEDIGVGREQMHAEALRYAPPVIKLLKKKKLLDGIVRRRLSGFYASEACAKLLAVS